MKTKLLLLALALSACAPKDRSQVIPQVAEWDLIKYEDKAGNVVCYRVRGYEGLSCLERR